MSHSRIVRLAWHIGLPASGGEADAVVIFGATGPIGTWRNWLGCILPVLMVPRGSGNDFARALGIANFGQALAAWQRFCHAGGDSCLVDLGIVTELPSELPNPPEGEADVFADGEYVCRTPVEFGVVSKALRVVRARWSS